MCILLIGIVIVPTRLRISPTHALSSDLLPTLSMTSKPRKIVIGMEIIVSPLIPMMHACVAAAMIVAIAIIAFISFHLRRYFSSSALRGWNLAEYRRHATIPALHYEPKNSDYVIKPLSFDLRILINAVAKISLGVHGFQYLYLKPRGKKRPFACLYITEPWRSSFGRHGLGQEVMPDMITLL